MSNDRVMVATSKAMRNILRANRAEAKLTRIMADQNQKMAMDMRKDSISMKTVR